MRRREFIALVGGAAWPFVARAEQTGRLPTIGFLGTASASTWTSWTTAFVDRLRELGWVEGRTIAIEYRWAEGHSARFAEIAAEFVRPKVDVIVTSGGAVLQVKKATSTIPIVFAIASDPVGTGMVVSFARPGGNATGLSLESPDLAGKRLELLREAIPGVRRLAVLANVANPAGVPEMDEVKAAAGGLGFEITPVEIRRAEEIEPAFTGLKDRADALYVCGSDPMFNTNRLRINTLAVGAHLPTLHTLRVYVETGGLMSYGPVIPEMFSRAAELVDKILHGAKPTDIPVEQPTKFELLVNLTTAKAIGITIPESFLALANQVIE